MSVAVLAPRLVPTLLRGSRRNTLPLPDFLWEFGDGSGTTVSATYGGFPATFDASPGDPTWTAPGLDFDGGDGASFASDINISGDFVVSLAFQTDLTDSTVQTLLSAGSRPSIGIRAFEGGVAKVRIFPPDAGTFDLSVPGFTSGFGTYPRLIILSRVGSQYRLLADGTVASTHTNDALDWSFRRFGRRNGVEHFQGHILDVAIWGGTFSDTQLGDLWEKTRQRVEANHLVTINQESYNLIGDTGEQITGDTGDTIIGS